MLIAEGLSLLNHLLCVLELGSGFSKEKACIALQALSLSKENARAIDVEVESRLYLKFSKLGQWFLCFRCWDNGSYAFNWCSSLLMFLSFTC